MRVLSTGGIGAARDPLPWRPHLILPEPVVLARQLLLNGWPGVSASAEWTGAGGTEEKHSSTVTSPTGLVFFFSGIPTVAKED